MMAGKGQTCAFHQDVAPLKLSCQNDLLRVIYRLVIRADYRVCKSRAGYFQKAKDLDSG